MWYFSAIVDAPKETFCPFGNTWTAPAPGSLLGEIFQRGDFKRLFNWPGLSDLHSRDAQDFWCPECPRLLRRVTHRFPTVLQSHFPISGLLFSMPLIRKVSMLCPLQGVALAYPLKYMLRNQAVVPLHWHIWKEKSLATIVRCLAASAIKCLRWGVMIDCCHQRQCYSDISGRCQYTLFRSRCLNSCLRLLF